MNTARTVEKGIISTPLAVTQNPPETRIPDIRMALIKPSMPEKYTADIAKTVTPVTKRLKPHKG